MKKKKTSPRVLANFCLDLWVPDEARWRICSVTQDKISQLQTKLTFNILDQQLKGNANLIANVLSNARLGREPVVREWSWQTQTNWDGYCKSTFMQSPINIVKKDITNDGVNFLINYHLLPVNTLIKRNYKEVIVAFMNYGGLFQFSIEGTYLLFTPTHMSFRFPGDHTINGVRPFGEILIHFAELGKQRVNNLFILL
jgi:hypothetical protein